MWPTWAIILAVILGLGVIAVIVGASTNWFGTSDDANPFAGANAPNSTSFTPTKGTKCTCDIIKHNDADPNYVPIGPGSSNGAGKNDITIDLRCQTSNADNTYAQCGCQGLLTVDCNVNGSDDVTASRKLGTADNQYNDANNSLTSINFAPELRETPTVNGDDLWQTKTSGSESGAGRHGQIVYQKVRQTSGDQYVSLNGQPVSVT